MKRLFLILFFTITLSLQKAEAQLAPVGTKWTYEWMHWDKGMGLQWLGKTLFTNAKDTILDSLTYSAVITNFDTNYLTIQNNKIYYYYNFRKCLFFDFNAKKKDTIYVDLCFPGGYNYKGPVFNNYPVVLNNIYYYYLSTHDSILYYQINDTSGSHISVLNPKIFFGPQNQMGDVGFDLISLFPNLPFEGTTTFKCYEEPGSMVIKADSSVDCARVGISEIQTLEKSISIFPNPSSGEFTLEINGNLKAKKITVYNILGDLMKSEIVSDGKNFKISLKEKASGNYFVVVELDNEVRVLFSELGHPKNFHQ